MRNFVAGMLAGILVTGAVAWKVWPEQPAADALPPTDAARLNYWKTIIQFRDDKTFDGVTGGIRTGWSPFLPRKSPTVYRCARGATRVVQLVPCDGVPRKWAEDDRIPNALEVQAWNDELVRVEMEIRAEMALRGDHGPIKGDPTMPGGG